jgi:hypothetical protein
VIVRRRGSHILSSLRAGRFSPPGRFLVPTSVRCWVDSRAIVRLEGWSKLKNATTSSGIERMTCRLIAECFNQLVAPVARLFSTPFWDKSKSKLYYDRQSVGQSVLVSGTHLGPAINFPPSLFSYFRQLWVCWCGAPSLTRSQVCSFQFLPDISSAALPLNALLSWSWS